MATKSGMDYGLVNTFIGDMESYRTSIRNNFEQLSSYVSSTLPSCYSGEAAEKYKAAVTSVSETINEALATIISDFKQQTAEFQTSYQKQDTENADSLSSIPVN